jgi:hypothetical protein
MPGNSLILHLLLFHHLLNTAASYLNKSCQNFNNSVITLNIETSMNNNGHINLI